MSNITGDRLRALRLEHELSQEEVAKKIGISRPAYVNYENGKSRPVRKLKELSDLFDTNIDYIMGRTDVPYRNPFEDGKTIGQLASEYKPHTPTETELKQEALNQVIARDKASASSDVLTEPKYYYDPEVAQMANELKDNPDMRILFDASRGLKKESIEEVVKFIAFQKAKERGDVD